MTNSPSSPTQNHRSFEGKFVAETVESIINGPVFDHKNPIDQTCENQKLSNKFKYLPVEFFKLAPQKYFHLTRPEKPTKTFLSSGTTSDQMSKSFFSSEGLNLYKYGSVRSFSEVISELLGNDWPTMTGISLIPDVKKDWQDSSLSQMISWIAEVSNLSYCTDLTELQKILRDNAERPIWIFATAFHLVNLFDEGLEADLHPKSIIIETGGTKGRSRSIEQNEFYDIVSTRFNIDSSRIVSEYGMCELASQAYKSNLNSFRFPNWVQCFVEDSEGNLLDSGQGCLTVYDSLRIDYPWPIRTQDFVTLNSDQSFTFEHRLKNTPLKGCSLNAEVVTRTKAAIQPKSRPKMIFLFKQIIEDKVQNLLPKIVEFLTSQHSLDLLTNEFNSSEDARYVLASLTDSIPRTTDAWDQILKTCQPNFKNWLFIPPNNHSIAMIYPLVVGLMANLNIWIRKTGNEDSLINVLISHLSKIPEAKVRVVANSFRIGSKASSEIEAVYIYGHDDTIRKVQSESDLSVQGFGDNLAISIVGIDNLITNSKELLEDAFSTTQRGCMSTRILIIQGPYDENIVKKFISKGERFINTRWNNEQDLSAKYNILHERLRHQHILEANSINTSSKCLFSSQPNLDKLTNKTLGDTPFTLPIFFTEEPLNNVIKHVASTYKNLNLVMIDESYQANFDEVFPAIEFRPHGRAQSPAWNGTHLGRPIFKVKEAEV